mgnify:CR=1 FL=1
MSMSSKEQGAIIAAFVWLAIVVAATYGWVMNIVQLYHSSFSEITGQLILRVIGIFVAPLGSVMGYL